MKDPRLTVALARQGDEPSLLISRNDNELLNNVSLELRHLNNLGSLGAQVMVGEYILLLLHAVHSEDFVAYPALMPQDMQMHRPIDLVSYLIEQTKLRKTRQLIPAIEIALAVYNEELKSTSIPKQWPAFKEVFERLYSD
ncbi:hypothetical protein HH212_14170 [Massilia forsythiae]|uniref:Uncharacterized protein n=1 Tax=Massilia forsythiae TaxID=2728020 RepID=A0A7Z2VXU4_9BURK|nr:hypothetical protein [Massilia forsythiae]QJE01035.1 hypothetical protein HH212_14170 [Massilia forsythiae]